MPSLVASSSPPVEKTRVTPPLSAEPDLMEKLGRDPTSPPPGPQASWPLVQVVSSHPPSAVT